MTLQEVKQRFFSFRNGIVAKAFSDAGAPYRIVFGLQLPQLSAIAKETGYDGSLARELWAESGCRESRLLACYLFDPQLMDIEEAVKLAEEAQTHEEADLLAFRLLRRLPYAGELASRLTGYPLTALSRWL